MALEADIVFYEKRVRTDFESLSMGIHKVHHCRVAYVIGEHNSGNNRPSGVAAARREGVCPAVFKDKKVNLPEN